MFPCAFSVVGKWGKTACFRVWGSWGGGDGENRSCHMLSMKGGNGENGSCHVLSMKGGKGESGSCRVLSMYEGKGEMRRMAETRESDHPEILFLGME
jgi:hypothetical protein